MMDFFAGPSFHEGSGSSALALSVNESTVNVANTMILAGFMVLVPASAIATTPAIIIAPATTNTIEAIGCAIAAAQAVFLIDSRSRCAATVFVGLGRGRG